MSLLSHNRSSSSFKVALWTGPAAVTCLQNVHYNVDGGTVKAGSEQGYCISGQHDSMTSRGHVLERGGPCRFPERTTALIPDLREVRKLAKGGYALPRQRNVKPWKPGRLRNRPSW